MDWIGIFKKLKKPNGKILTALYPVTILFCVGAITVVVLDATAVWGYPIYALAAITLFYSTYTLIRFAPNVKEWFTQTVQKWWFSKRLSEDYEFRTIVFAVCGFVFNGVYALFLGVMGIVFHSVWYGGLAFYYIVVTAVKGGILIGAERDNRKYKKDFKLLLQSRTRWYIRSGWALIITAQAVALSLIQLVWSGWSFHYADLMIFAFSAFAFFKISMAIYNLVKATKRNGIVTKAVRHINLATACVSILALQTALLDTFGGDGNFRLFNALTGMVVFIVIVILGAYTVVDGRKRLKKYQEGERSLSSEGRDGAK
ncbi:MAG: hypothetical protein IJW58_03870 [Clostridia bacterium]|nr:hypothetical protein [Clostridia bacterium]